MADPRIRITGEDRTGPAFKSVNDRFSRLTREVSGVGTAFRALQGAFVVGLGAGLAGQAVAAADAYANVNARLKLATGSTNEFVRAQREVFAIAQRSGTALESTADLYGSLSRNASALGASQDDLLRVTETIGKAFQVSGTSAGAASAAITQLGQAFASGVLRGDELNSVLEQAPRLARAIADGLGVTVGQLRELGKAGELTAEQVFAALRQAGADIDREFSQLPETVERATQKASNSVLRFVGVLDQLTGVSRGVAGSVSSFSGNLDGLSGSLQRGERDARGYVDALIQLTRYLPAVNAGLILLRRSLPDVPTPAGLNLPASLNDPRAGRGYVDPREQKLQDARIAFLDKFATRQEKLNATIAEYRRLLGDSFTKADEDRIRAAFSGAGGRGGKTGDAAAERLAQEQYALSFYLKDFGSEQSDAEMERLLRLNEQLVGQFQIDIPEAALTAEQAIRQAFNASEMDYEAVDAAVKALGDTTRKTSDLAADLGMTFSSAFEDAIVSGKGLRDLLAGLEQDILRIITRQLVTQPLANSITSLLGGPGGGGDIFSKIAGSIGSFFGGGFADGGYLAPGKVGIVGERGPELIYGGRQGMTVQPDAGRPLSVYNSFQLSGPVDRRTLQQVYAAAARGVERASSRNN